MYIAPRNWSGQLTAFINLPSFLSWTLFWACQTSCETFKSAGDHKSSLTGELCTQMCFGHCLVFLIRLVSLILFSFLCTQYLRRGQKTPYHYFTNRWCMAEHGVPIIWFVQIKKLFKKLKETVKVTDGLLSAFRNVCMFFLAYLLIPTTTDAHKCTHARTHRSAQSLEAASSCWYGYIWENVVQVTSDIVMVII